MTSMTWPARVWGSLTHFADRMRAPELRQEPSTPEQKAFRARLFEEFFQEHIASHHHPGCPTLSSMDLRDCTC